MGYYKVYGKEYYGELSDFFEEIVEADSPKAALCRFALGIAGMDSEEDIDWASDKPGAINAGWLATEPTFWTEYGHILKIRRIVAVKPTRVTCPACHGGGQTDGYIELDE